MAEEEREPTTQETSASAEEEEPAAGESQSSAEEAALEPGVEEPVKEPIKSVPVFGVNQLLTSKRFIGIEKDVLRGVLSPDRKYTLDEARAAIKDYAERLVQ